MGAHQRIRQRRRRSLPLWTTLRHAWQTPQVVLGPVFWLLFRAATQQQRGWRYPAGPAEVRVPGVDPFRILVIGDGPAAGCGVLLHEMGIAGTVARHVAAATGRAVVVTVSAAPDASARSTLYGLDALDLDPYDVIVLMLATTDAFCLTGRRSWRRSMTGLVRRLTAGSSASVLVTSVASMQLTRTLSPLARRVTGRHARLLDVETRQICAASRTPMITLDAANDLTARTYARWGRRIGIEAVACLRAREKDRAARRRDREA